MEDNPAEDSPGEDGRTERPKASALWRAFQFLSTPERFSWVLAILISAGISLAISFVLQSQPIAAGGDPGTWLATAYGFFHANHPSQSIPLAYPPVLFPLLGVTMYLTGGPVAAAQVFAPVLYFFVGLSIFFLASQMLRSRLVALTVTAVVLIDPQLIEMLFWGAYPNLLGFVFLYVALGGLVMMGRGAVSRGAFVFWIFGMLTVLTHSLAGVLLAAVTFFVLLLSWPIPVPSQQEIQARSAGGEADVPAVLRRGLVLSRGGRVGIVVFSVAVGAYYILTALAHVPHPSYFVSNPLAFQAAGLSGFFHSIFPGFTIQSVIVVTLLGLTILAILLLYGILFMSRTQWLSTPVIVLMASGVAIAFTPVVGWMLRIITDYTRFGFFLIVPIALSFGYLIDRGWVSAHRKSTTPPARTAVPASPTIQRWLRRSPHPRRAVAFAIVSFVVGLMIAGALTGPALGRLETQFTKVGHDQNFVDALNAIDRTGIPGNILTIPGADKWARAISERNAYAPYTQSTYLFAVNQILDSDLSYYALMSHYAVTNGLVSATVRGVSPGYINGTANNISSYGIPGYGAYVVGAYHPVLQVKGNGLSVVLINATTGIGYMEPVTVLPTVLLPSTPGAPLEILFNQTGTATASGFDLEIFAAPVPGVPQLTLYFTAIATGADSLATLNVPLVPANGTSAQVSFSTVGQFNWRTFSTAGAVRGPLTVGNVTPVSALVNAGSNQTDLSFRASAPTGERSIAGQLSLWTTTGSTLDNVLPPVLDTPGIWSELDVRFILMKEPAAYTGPAPQTVSTAGEIPYLENEFGVTQIYNNTGWSVLQVPADE
ncbi:MAG: hypothetical protein ABSA63_04520 [Thermoplasmata archaeon]